MSKELQIFDSVVYKKNMKCLPKEAVGVLTSIYGDKGTVSYPQFAPKEINGKYQYSNYVYAHSALLSDLKHADEPESPTLSRNLIDEA